MRTTLLVQFAISTLFFQTVFAQKIETETATLSGGQDKLVIPAV